MKKNTTTSKSSLSITLALFLFYSCSHQKIELETFRDPANFQTCFQLMQSFFSHNKGNISPFAHFEYKNAQSLDELENAYGTESINNIQRRLSQEEIIDNNLNLEKLLALPTTILANDKNTRYVTKEEAQKILDHVKTSNVNKNHYCYDTNGTTGFCFGRATIGHMEALVRGVHPDSIKKIWIAGDMGKWGHHVANLIKAEQGWYVLDTNLSRVVSPAEWVKTYIPMKKAGAKDIMVFVTHAERFGPYDSQSYTAINLFNSNTNSFNKQNDFYKGYFHDYFEDLEKELPNIQKFPVR